MDAETRVEPGDPALEIGVRERPPADIRIVALPPDEAAPEAGDGGPAGDRPPDGTRATEATESGQAPPAMAVLAAESLDQPAGDPTAIAGWSVDRTATVATPIPSLRPWFRRVRGRLAAGGGVAGPVAPAERATEPADAATASDPTAIPGWYLSSAAPVAAPPLATPRRRRRAPATAAPVVPEPVEANASEAIAPVVTAEPPAQAPDGPRAAEDAPAHEAPPVAPWYEAPDVAAATAADIERATAETTAATLAVPLGAPVDLPVAPGEVPVASPALAPAAPEPPGVASRVAAAIAAGIRVYASAFGQAIRQALLRVANAFADRLASPRLLKVQVFLLVVGVFAVGGAAALTQIGPIIIRGDVVIEAPAVRNPSAATGCTGSTSAGVILPGAHVEIWDAAAAGAIAEGTLGTGVMSGGQCRLPFIVEGVRRGFGEYLVRLVDAAGNPLGVEMVVEEADVGRKVVLEEVSPE